MSDNVNVCMIGVSSLVLRRNTFTDRMYRLASKSWLNTVVTLLENLSFVCGGGWWRCPLQPTLGFPMQQNITPLTRLGYSLPAVEINVLNTNISVCVLTGASSLFLRLFECEIKCNMHGISWSATPRQSALLVSSVASHRQRHDGSILVRWTPMAVPWRSPSHNMIPVPKRTSKHHFKLSPNTNIDPKPTPQLDTLNLIPTYNPEANAEVMLDRWA